MNQTQAKGRVITLAVVLATALGLSAVGSAVAQQQVEQKKESVSFSIPKTLYFTGEKIWIDASVALGDEPTTSQVLYVELVSRHSKSMASAKLPLLQGEAFNYLQIAPNIPSDHYLLRVYTRISPYLDQELGIAQQLVTVVNPAIPPIGQTGSTAETLVSSPQPEAGFSPSQNISLPNPSEQNRVMGISIANPFLPDEQEQIASSDAYKSLTEKELIPELFGHVVELVAPNADPKSTYFLSVHGKKSALFTDTPDSEGRVLVDAGGLKHWDRMIIQLEDGAEMPGIDVVQPLIQTRFKSEFNFPSLTIGENDLPRLEQLLKASRVDGYYVEDYLLDSMEVVVGFVADHTYDLDDYTRFEDVETVLREYVPSVMVRTEDKKKEFRLINEAVKGTFDANPLILVDAMPVFDSDLLASFNPRFMKKLEVLNREFYLNQRTYSGVLSWSSYDNNFGLFPLAPSARFFDYYGLQPKILMDRGQFAKSSQNGSYPDWRTVLFWDKNAKGLADVEAPALDGLYVFWERSTDSTGKAKVSRSYFSVQP